jgi:HSP20 family molecular chaperone IbpA
MTTTKTQTHSAPKQALRPRTDVLETAEALILVADLAGVDDGSVELSLTDDVLTLRARPAPCGASSRSATTSAGSASRPISTAMRSRRRSSRAACR